MKRTFLMFLFIAVILVLLQKTRIEGRLLDDNRIQCDVGDIESYLDQILKNVTAEMPNPIKLPNRIGFVHLTEGEMWGFPTLKREGSATIVCDENGLVITANLKVDEMTGRYKWSKKLITKEFKGLTVVMAKIFEVKIKVTQKSTPGSHLELDTFKITKMEGIDVEVTGLNYVTWAASKLIDPVLELFKRSTARIVSGPIKKALSRELSSIRIPF